MGNANMTQERTFDPLQPQLLEGEVLRVEEMARLCCVTTEWLQARIEQEVVHAVHRDGAYYLSSATVIRVQQVAKIEQTYDADPQLAALVADLVEEVQHLRRQIERHKTG
jgi:chaperone modulatory protein CbpM